MDLKHATAKNVVGFLLTKIVALATNNAVKTSHVTAKNVTKAQAVVNAVAFRVKKFARLNQAVRFVVTSQVSSVAAQNQVSKFVHSQHLRANSAARFLTVSKNAVQSQVVIQFVPHAQVAKFANKAQAVVSVIKNQVSAFVLAVQTAKIATTFQVKISAAQFRTKIVNAATTQFLTAKLFQAVTYANRFLTKRTSAVT